MRFSEMRKPQKYGRRCGANPPDLPPTMAGLTFIESGEKDMLPVKSAESRRRVSGNL